jgi:hypothetical protein
MIGTVSMAMKPKGSAGQRENFSISQPGGGSKTGSHTATMGRSSS